MCKYTLLLKLGKSKLTVSVEKPAVKSGLFPSSYRDTPGDLNITAGLEKATLELEYKTHTIIDKTKYLNILFFIYFC